VAKDAKDAGDHMKLIKAFIDKIQQLRLWPMVLKELRQIKGDKKLVISLILPPTFQLVIFGFALNPEVTDLKLGVVDESHTSFSRRVVSAFVESRSFRVAGSFDSAEALSRALSAGQLDAGLVIPSDFARKRVRRETADVQLLIDAVNSNTAGIAEGYAARIINGLNSEDTASGVRLSTSGDGSGLHGTIASRIALLFNPGLESAWFIVTGVMGILFILNGSIIGSATMVKEKEAGTVEQLLMTPAQSGEIIVSKIAPLFVVLSADIVLALIVGRLLFGVPVRGSILLLCGAGMLCIFAGIGLGTFLASFSKTQQQAQLLSFFTNPPLAMLGGATTPVEAMPDWMQPLSMANPIRHFSTIARGVMLRGAGVGELYVSLLILAGSALLLVGVSAWRFRKQM
jgi:ABC-2 type transport system permease protein